MTGRPSPSYRGDLLVVDDNPNNIELLVAMLGDRGYHCRVATSGSRALVAVAAQRPDLILLDISMPEMDGFEVCRVLKADPETQGLPVIFVSALDGTFDKVAAFEAGAADYVTKPLRVEEVLARVECHLKIARMQLALEERNATLSKLNRDLVIVSRDLREANRRLRELSSSDGLTGVANRRRFDEVLAEEWRSSVDDGGRLAVLLLDVDHFKSYNDSLGHLAGDECLQQVADALREALAGLDGLVARYGGEEFGVVLPGADPIVATETAETIRRRVEALQLPHPASKAGRVVTISVGVAAAAPTDGSRPTSLVERADRALYRAKEQGRNRVVTDSPGS